VFLRRPSVPNTLKNLDSIQKLPLEFVTGGAVIYLVALIMTPFHGFTAAVCWAITGISAFFYLYQHFKGLASFNKPSTYSWVALLAFVIALAIRVGPVSNFVLGSNQDLSWHTLLAYSVIRNGGIPFSVIEGFILQVPVGVHTNLVYFSLITGIPAEFVTFYSLVFFGTIVGLAAYLFGTIMHSQKFGLYISLVMITITYYPSAINWGSPWLTLGLLIFFVTAPLIISFSTENANLNKSGILTAFFPGVMTGFLASTFIPLYVILLFLLLFWILLGRQNIIHRLKGIAIIFMLGVPLFAVWIYRFFFLVQPTTDWIAEWAARMMYTQALEKSALFLPYRWLDSPNVVINTVGNWLAWDYRNGWPGSILSFWLLVFGGVLLVRFLLNYRVKGLDSFVPRYVLSTIFALLLWFLNAPVPPGVFYITSFGLGIMMSELDKVTAIMGPILLSIIAAYAIITIGNFISNFISNRRKVRKFMSAGVVLLVILVSVALAPLARAWLYDNTRIFASSTESDYELLKWMHSEIPSNSNVLVNTEDAGQYVPSIGGQNAVHFGSSGVKAITEKYHILYNQIRDKVFNLTTIELLANMSTIYTERKETSTGITVDYVFLGAQAMLVGGWDPIYFLRNPWYFRLVHSVNQSGLFEVNLPNRKVSDGYIWSRDYLGFSSNETCLDLQNMMLIDLEKGESVFIEIGLNDEKGKPLEVINYWDPRYLDPITGKEERYPGFIESSAINLTGTSNFTLRRPGSNYPFNIAVSLTETNGINVNVSAENSPPGSTIYLSYLPIYDIKQGSLHFTTDETYSSLLSSRVPLQGIRRDGVTAFEMIPSPQQVVTTYSYYISARSIGDLNIIVHTETLDETK
jgi:hypothetical protein